MSITDICIQASYSLTATNNEKDSEYNDELSMNLVEMYSCVVFAINGVKPNLKLYEQFGRIATFIVRSCDKNLKPTVVSYSPNLVILEKLPLLAS